MICIYVCIYVCIYIYIYMLFKDAVVAWQGLHRREFDVFGRPAETNI